MTGFTTFRRDPVATAFAGAVALLPSSAAVIFYSQGFFLGPVTQEFGWTRSQFMGTVTMALIALAVLYPLAGRLGDRFGARHVLVPGILLFGLGMMSLSLVGDNLLLYAVLTILIGMAGVVQSPLLYSMVVAHRAPLHSRGKLIAICTTGVPLGNMAIPPLVVWLITEFGWRGARVGLGLAILFCALPVALLFMGDAREPIKSVSRKTRSAALSVISRRPGILLLSAIFLSGLALNGFLVSLVPMVTDRGLLPSDAARILVIAAIAGVFGRIGAGWLLDRVQKPQIGVLWYIAGTIGIGLSFYPGGALVLTIGSICLGLALGAETELGAYYTSRFYDRKHFGEVLGLLSCCYTIGGALGGQMFSVSFDYFGDYVLASIVAAVLVAVSALLLLALPAYPALSDSEGH